MWLIDKVQQAFNYCFPSKIKMGVLGMEMSGKTTWFHYLKTGKIDKTYKGSNCEPIDVAKVKGPNNSYFKIAKTVDIGGRLDLVHHFYETIIKENDVIVFFFRADRFMSEKKDYLDVINRLAIISELTRDVKSVKKKVFIVPTHKDKVDSNVTEEQMRRKLLDGLLSDKSASKYAKGEYIARWVKTNDNVDIVYLKIWIFKRIQS